MINKRDLARRVSKRTLLSIKESVQVIDVLFDAMLEELSNDNEISIVNFGKFFLYKQKPRPVRNPKTMEEMILEEFETVKFKQSDNLKQKLKIKREKNDDI
jgi:nucleoid DNA-binding protein